MKSWFSIKNPRPRPFSTTGLIWTGGWSCIRNCWSSAVCLMFDEEITNLVRLGQIITSAIGVGLNCVSCGQDILFYGLDINLKFGLVLVHARYLYLKCGLIF